jgi:hypothetical protein
MFAGRAAQEAKKTTRPAKEATPAAPLRPPAAGSRLLFLVNRSPAEWTGAPADDFQHVGARRRCLVP